MFLCRPGPARRAPGSADNGKVKGSGVGYGGNRIDPGEGRGAD
jgi:hypothetical protein